MTKDIKKDTIFNDETDQPSYQTESARQQISELNVALNYDINTVYISGGGFYNQQLAI